VKPVRIPGISWVIPILATGFNFLRCFSAAPAVRIGEPLGEQKENIAGSNWAIFAVDGSAIKAYRSPL
jgi:hypothetical protein